MKQRDHHSPSAGQAALQLNLPWQDAPIPVPSSMPKPPAHGRGARHTQLGGQAIAYELRRSQRRTIGLMIDEGGLRVTAPTWVTLNEIESVLQAKQRWILRKLDSWHAHAQHRAERLHAWQDGGQLDYQGGRITLRVLTHALPVALHDKVLQVGSESPTPDAVRGMVHRWLQARALEVFGARLPIYASRLGQFPRRWGLSSARTRWGSCTANGTIRLNWRLIHLPVSVIDYVIAHELAHLREMNHSPRFWATVHQLMPDFEIARRQLKHYPHAEFQ
jgi:predicted metal-dependent hydrolase